MRPGGFVLVFSSVYWQLASIRSGTLLPPGGVEYYFVSLGEPTKVGTAEEMPALEQLTSAFENPPDTFVAMLLRDTFLKFTKEKSTTIQATE